PAGRRAFRGGAVAGGGGSSDRGRLFLPFRGVSALSKGSAPLKPEPTASKVLLVDTRELARVPGRNKKTDPSDCEWIQRLHSCGLLRGSFRPEEAVCMLRT